MPVIRHGGNEHSINNFFGWQFFKVVLVGLFRPSLKSGEDYLLLSEAGIHKITVQVTFACHLDPMALAAESPFLTRTRHLEMVMVYLLLSYLLGLHGVLQSLEV